MVKFSDVLDLFKNIHPMKNQGIELGVEVCGDLIDSDPCYGPECLMPENVAVFYPRTSCDDSNDLQELEWLNARIQMVIDHLRKSEQADLLKRKCATEREM
jgi:hypothetical protein